VYWIKEQMTRIKAHREQGFAVVVGPRGVGMTTAVETAAEGLPGVITLLNIQPGTNKDVIMNMVFEQINGPLWNIKDKDVQKENRALEIIEAFKKISGGQAPILIITAEEQHPSDDHAALTASGRTLSEHFYLNVVIDAAENALPSKLTGRERILEMKPMTDSMMRQLPQFKKLLDYLVSTGNDKIVLVVCGGCPLLLSKLKGKVKGEDKTKTEDEQAVRYFVYDELREAHLKIALLCSSASPMKSVSFFFAIYNKLVDCF
jgi:hypothetical protein